MDALLHFPVLGVEVKEAARTAADPDATLLAFVQSTYEAGAKLADCNRAALER